MKTSNYLLKVIMIFVIHYCTSQLVNGDTERQNQIALFKEYLLEKLEMKSEPKISGRYILPRTLEKREVLDKPLDNFRTNTIVNGASSGKNGYKFDFSTINLSESKKIHTAKLTIFLEEQRSFKVLTVRHYASKEKIVQIPVEKTDYGINIDIGSKINLWAKGARKNDILRLKFDCNAKKCLDVNIPPIIEVEYSTQSRVKRQHSKCSTDNKCCLKHLTFTVKELGWENWFIAPQKISFSYCAGTCTEDQLTFHGRLVKIATNNKRKPCCIPSKLENFNMMHLSDNQTTYVKLLRNIRVTECICS